MADFLRGNQSAREYLSALGSGAKRFNGFSLLIDDGSEMLFFSNKDCAIQEVPAGVHGLSNHLLNEPWPKVTRGVQRIRSMIDRDAVDSEALFDMLADKAIAADSDLPDTGVGVERERELSPMFILGGSYGTRSSTVIHIANRASLQFEERSFDANANEASRVVHTVGD